MYRLRSRTAADCEAIVNWIPDSAALYLFTGPRFDWPLDAAHLSAMEHDGYRAWTLVEGGADGAIGHVDLTVDGGIARIGRVLISPAHRGRGLAHVLVALVVDQAKSLGASELRLNVITRNHIAIRTYERAGFVAQPQSERHDVSVMSLSL